MWRAELARAIAYSPEVAGDRGVLVVLDDVVRAIAVSDPKTAIGRERDVRRADRGMMTCILCDVWCSVGETQRVIVPKASDITCRIDYDSSHTGGEVPKGNPDPGLVCFVGCVESMN